MVKELENKMVKVYIDGQEGTTGLKILERFKGRNDIELLKIDEGKRKDVNERKKFINASDFTFLCLPDAAAREAVALADSDHVRIIDASTAHRTNPDWAYGFPELSPEHREKIRASKRVANPGCYASGFISLVYPLVKAGLIPADFPVFAYATSGYSGAGKKAIAAYESENKPQELLSPRQYALNMNHKHLPEMQLISGLSCKPMFNPIVDNYYSGMVVSVPLQPKLTGISCTPEQVREALYENYKDAKLIEVKPTGSECVPDGFLTSNGLSGTNKMELYVFGNSEQMLLCSRLDNLGKGASGAAVQCLNIMMGIDETTGLI